MSFQELIHVFIYTEVRLTLAVHHSPCETTHWQSRRRNFSLQSQEGCLRLPRSYTLGGDPSWSGKSWPWHLILSTSVRLSDFSRPSPVTVPDQKSNQALPLWQVENLLLPQHGHTQSQEQLPARLILVLKKHFNWKFNLRLQTPV